MSEFVTALVDLTIASGIGEKYAATGVSIQDGYRRDTGADIVALFRQATGVSFPFDQTEEQGIQVLVDATTVSGARTTARAIYNLLHNRIAETQGGFRFLWLRGVAPPQDLGPGPADSKRFTVTANYTARLLR